MSETGCTDRRFLDFIRNGITTLCTHACACIKTRTSRRRRSRV